MTMKILVMDDAGTIRAVKSDNFKQLTQAQIDGVNLGLRPDLLSDPTAVYVGPNGEFLQAEATLVEVEEVERVVADVSGLQPTLDALANSVTTLQSQNATLNARLAALENTSTTPPAPPTIDTDPSVAFPGGTATVGETATITPTVWTSGTVVDRLFQIKVNGTFYGQPFSSLTFEVPPASDPRAISVVETTNFGAFQLSAETEPYFLAVTDPSLAEDILAAAVNWWAFEDTGANTGLTAHKGNAVLSVGNGKNASNMSATGGNQGRMGRFATNSPHSDSFFVAAADGGGNGGDFDWANQARTMCAWIAPRQSISNFVDRFILGRLHGFDTTEDSWGLYWHAGAGVSEQGFKFVAKQASNGARIEVRPATYFTPSGALALQHVAVAHDPDANKIYIWVNGVKSEAVFDGAGIASDDTSLFSIGNGMNASAVPFTDHAFAFDIDDLCHFNRVLTDDEVALLATPGNGVDAIAALADVDLTPVSGGGSGGGTTPPEPPPEPPPTGRDFTRTPFPLTAFVNRLIPDNAVEAGDSDPRTVAIRSCSTISTTYFDYSIPIYRAVASSPIRSFSVRFSTQTIDIGTNVQIPIPVGATPTEGRNYTRYSGPGNLGAWEVRDSNGNVNHSFDGIISIISADGLYIHELYHAYIDPNTGAYHCWSYARIPLQTHTGTYLKGPGCQAIHGTYKDPTILGYGGISARASGFTGSWGLIREGEITNTTLWPNGPEHKLVMHLPSNLMYFNGSWGDTTENRNWIRPAAAPEQRGNAGGAIKVGQTFRIRKSVNLAGLGLSSAALQLAKCLQRYGCVLSDDHGINHVRFNADIVGANADGAALAAQSANMITIKNLLTAVDGVGS